MTTSETVTLSSAFANVELTPGAAGTLLQWMASQIGTDTEAGAALRDAGIRVGLPPEPATKSASSATTSTTTKASTSS